MTPKPIHYRWACSLCITSAWRIKICLDSSRVRPCPSTNFNRSWLSSFWVKQPRARKTDKQNISSLSKDPTVHLNSFELHQIAHSQTSIPYICSHCFQKTHELISTSAYNSFLFCWLKTRPSAMCSVPSEMAATSNMNAIRGSPDQQG